MSTDHEEEYGADWLRRQVDAVHDRIVAEFAGRVPPEVIASLVARAHAHLSGAPVRTFLPMLVEREVRRDIWRLTVAADRDVA